MKITGVHRPPAWFDGQMSSFMTEFAEFIAASPSSFHATAEIARQLDNHGWSEATLSEPAPTRGYRRRDGAIVAWHQAHTVRPDAPYRIIGTHTDSPGLMLKPNPSFSANGYLQVGVEVYGGPILASWFDRELELAGRIIDRNGTEHLVRTGPILRIPHLAIHLDRDAQATFSPDRQRHLQPIWGVGAVADVMDLLASLAGIHRDDIGGIELITVPTEPAQRFGRDNELFASARLDNLSSTFAALTAFLTGDFGDTHTSVFAAFNHEEVGSETAVGASGPLLADVLDWLSDTHSATSTDRRVARSASWMVSADAGHAVHPNYPDRHDPVNRPTLGGGPLLKLNANQRYASDANGAALWDRLCRAADVPWQPFVSNNDVPCGSTIGPLAATRLGVRTVDVGTPLLSMHSARELCHVNDVPALSAALTAFVSGV